jgi:hypothetical protein
MWESFGMAKLIQASFMVEREAKHNRKREPHDRADN